MKLKYKTWHVIFGMKQLANSQKTTVCGEISLEMVAVG